MLCNVKCTACTVWAAFCGSILCKSVKLTEPPDAEPHVRWCERSAAKAASYSIVENMWGETKEGVKRYCIQPEKLLDLLKAIGSDNLGICWDTEHGAIENLDQDKAIAKVGPYLRATHISDQTDRGNVHVLPYTGNTDWDMILKALAKADYKGAFTYEIQHYLLAMPEKLVPDAILLSYKVGEEMADQLEHYKKILA